MTVGEIESAERRALNIFDEWNDVAGCIEEHCGYYYEFQGVIKNAVHCGIQAALKQYKKIPDCDSDVDKIFLKRYK